MSYDAGTIRNVDLGSFQETKPDNDFFNLLFNEGFEIISSFVDSYSWGEFGIHFEKDGEFVGFIESKSGYDSYCFNIKNATYFKIDDEEQNRKIQKIILDYFLQNNSVTLDGITEENVELVESKKYGYYCGHYYLYCTVEDDDKQLNSLFETVINSLGKVKNLKKYVKERSGGSCCLFLNISGYECELHCYSVNYPKCDHYAVFLYVNELKHRFSKIYDKNNKFFNKIF